MIVERTPLAFLALVAACSVPTGPADVVDVRGTWVYSAVQGAPPAVLEGTLVLDRQHGGGFSGRLEVRETNAAGFERARAGGAAGHAIDAGSLDFDAFLSTAPRRHVARLTADTISGAWIEPTPGATLIGTFLAVRRKP